MSKKFKILVVDDEPIDLQVIIGALKDKYKVITAQSGKEAIDLTKQHRPDLIILDVMMPEMSGFKVCENLKGDPQFANIPIVFVTAFDTKDGELLGLELGGIDYITKPINFEHLKLRLKNQLVLKEQLEIITLQKEELETTLARVKQLEGIIPICMYCKSIRNDHEDWERLEAYLTVHTDAQFSHGICTTCMEEKFPEFNS